MLNNQEILIRLILAVAIGGVVGWERETARRPAGFRTHILVSVGSAMIMLCGIYVAGTVNGDATRMAAQVVSGIGFLGAGTIMREGANVKGLTTAASLWAVACIGLAAGAGFYVGAVGGLVITMITLTSFERVEKKMQGGKFSRAMVFITCTDPSKLIYSISEIASVNNIEMKNTKVKESDAANVFEVSFRFSAKVSSLSSDYNYMTARISGLPGVKSVTMDEF